MSARRDILKTLANSGSLCYYLALSMIMLYLLQVDVCMHSMMFLHRFCIVEQAQIRTANYEHHQTIRQHFLGDIDS